MNNERVVTYEQHKLGLSWGCVLPDGIHTEPIEYHLEPTLTGRRFRRFRRAVFVAVDVVGPEFFLTIVDVLDINGRPDHFGYKKNKAVSYLGANEGLVPCDILFNVLIAQAFHLLVFQLHANRFFGFAC